MAKESLTLDCGSCGHKNEPERVYCHNCGTKLDRTLLPKTVEKSSEAPEQTQKRVKKMMSPNRKGGATNELKTGIQVTIFAAIVAAMFLYWQAPEGVPVDDKEYIPTRDSMQLWDALMEARQASRITLDEKEVNYVLKKFLKANESSSGISFKRCAVDLKPGIVTVYVERNAWGINMTSAVSYKPVVRDGKVSGKIVSIHLGRLGIDPSMSDYVANWAIAGMWGAFKNEAKEAERLDRIVVEDGSIQFISKQLP